MNLMVITQSTRLVEVVSEVLKTHPLVVTQALCTDTALRHMREKELPSSILMLHQGDICQLEKNVSRLRALIGYRPLLICGKDCELSGIFQGSLKLNRLLDYPLCSSQLSKEVPRALNVEESHSSVRLFQSSSRSIMPTLMA